MTAATPDAPQTPDRDAADAKTPAQPKGARLSQRRRRRGQLAVLCAAVCCTAATAVSLSLPRAADAEPYHAAAREAAAGMPLTFDSYEGRDVALPEEAVTLLRPNVMFSRRYVSHRPPRAASLLVVQVRDARDLLGHWPPNCYPSNGFTLEAPESRQWRVAGESLPGLRFRMHKTVDGRRAEQVVDFFMVLPDGRIVREMDTVTDAAARHDWRFYGAAQVQVLTSGAMSDAERDAVFRDLVSAHQPLLDTLRAGRDTQPASG